MAVNTIAYHSDRAVETSSCTTDAKDYHLIYLYGPTLSRSDQLDLPLAYFLAGHETTSETAAVIELFANTKGPGFEVDLFNIQVKSLACCQKISDRIVRKYER